MYGRYVALREKKGVTDYRVAVETGITKSTFSDWKSGRSVPKADKLLSLAKYFGSRNFVVDATFLYLVASTLNGIQNAFKWNTVISDFW